MTPERIREKADAFYQAWVQRFGAAPSTHAMALGLAVAIHETMAGDAPGWEGENQWGACQQRTLTNDEKAVLAAAGIWPPAIGATAAQRASAVAQARSALAAAVAAGAIPANPTGALHVDSSPGQPRYYWVFFAAFPDDVAGAAFFIRVLAESHAATRAILDRPTSTARELASAMRDARYFEGRYVQTQLYELDGGRWVPSTDPYTDHPTRLGRELNIDEYGAALDRLLPEIRGALLEWAPSEPQPPDAA